jgi:hypothetical protein
VPRCGFLTGRHVQKGPSIADLASEGGIELAERLEKLEVTTPYGLEHGAIEGHPVEDTSRAPLPWTQP